MKVGSRSSWPWPHGWHSLRCSVLDRSGTRVPGQSAGERTVAIVALGAAAFSSTAITMFPETAGQAVAGVATGIGFLGVGIIWRAEEGETRGLTTAASILCVAAIGIVTGIGLYLA